MSDRPVTSAPDAAKAHVVVDRVGERLVWALLVADSSKWPLPMARVEAAEETFILRALDRTGMDVARSGDIRLGRVRHAVSGHAAVLVDVGCGSLGYLQARSPATASLPPIGALGWYRVRRGAIGHKGPSLVPFDALAGTLVTLGHVAVGHGVYPGVGLSSRIRPAARRAALSALLTEGLYEGEAIVVRTDAAAASDGAIMAELQTLRGDLARLRADAADLAGPGLLRNGPSPLTVWAEAGYPAARLTVSGAVPPAHLSALRIECQALGCTLSVDPALPGQPSLLERFGVSAILEAVQDPLVPLPGSGALRVERTAALWAIDVDAGSSSPAQAAAEAVAAIPALLALWAPDGQVLLDLPRMARGQPDPALVGRLKAALDSDALATTRLLGVTPGGLVEMRRTADGPSVVEWLRDLDGYR